MTQVTFYRTQNGYFSAVDLLGHAEYAEEGEDIVCAAVSSSAQLIHALLYDVQKIAVDTVIEEQGAHIRFTLPQEGLAKGQDGMRALFLHLSELAHNYSEFIQVTEVYNNAAN